jgi:hypothetical protein
MSKTDKPRIAEEDIICYKVLCKSNGVFGSKWVTPITEMSIRNAVLTGRRLMKARGEREIIGLYLNDNYIYAVAGGYIHTYKQVPPFPPFYYKIGDIVFECVIPKGEEYFKSVDGHEYASRSIRFVKQIF